MSVENLRNGGDGEKQFVIGLLAGQITGVFGLVGSGRTETFKGGGRCDQARHYVTAVRFCCTTSRFDTLYPPAPAVRDGIVYVTEDRKLEGLFRNQISRLPTFILVFFSPKEARGKTKGWCLEP